MTVGIGYLTITGNGAANTIIDGDDIDRVFHVCPDVPADGCPNTVTFTGMTIRNGNSADYGAGINNVSGTTIVDSSTVISNTAAIDGGGIYNDGNLTVRNGSAIAWPARPTRPPPSPAASTLTCPSNPPASTGLATSRSTGVSADSSS